MNIEQMILDNERLVYYVYINKILKADFIAKEREDILQEGRIALYNAAKNYNPESGFAFSTYAIKSIYMGMLSYIKKARQRAFDISLETPINGFGDETLQDIIPDPRNEIEHYIERQDLLDRIREQYPKLTVRERQIVEYQIAGLTQKEIAEKMQTRRQYVGGVIAKIRLKVNNKYYE